MMFMTKKETDARRVAVIGAGAAGMMAAITAAEAGAAVTLFERNDRVGKKLRITGKGRCNVTNNCDNNEFLSNVPTNPRFLYASLSRFSTADTMAFFEDAGVPLKTERGKRVFPVSDRAADIVSAMERRCREVGVKIVHQRVRGLNIENGCIVGVRCGDRHPTISSSALPFSSCLQSFPASGSFPVSQLFASGGQSIGASASSFQ